MDPYKLRFQIFLVIFLVVFTFGTAGFMVIERRSVIDALYFSIVTIATVGYGDVHPVTLPGKILTVVIIVTGVGTFMGVIANATEMMLNKREKKAKFEKLNIIIGTFFSEAGRHLLADFSRLDPQLENIRNTLLITKDWSVKDFVRAGRILETYDYAVAIQNYDLEILKSFLLRKRDFLLRLLENPVLFEHETFTQLLQAVFHITEELSYRDNLKQIPDTDRAHLASDIKRAYAMLVQQWLRYIEYVKNNYPFLFSLALRTNPFDENSSPIVE